jgi:predicted nicotinamide N-methyase
MAHGTEARVRMNDDSATTISVRVMGKEYTLRQDPTSHNHGLVLWDAALALVRWLEVAPKALAPLRGKRVLELGAGCGLVGLVLADHVGADATLTDLPCVLPNLRANVAANIGYPSSAGSGGEEGGADSVETGSGGRARVLAYSWGDGVEGLLAAAGGPFDFILGTDVSYSQLLNPILIASAAAIAVASEAAAAAAGRRLARCTLLFANELRCELAQAVFDAAAAEHFAVARVPPKQLHPDWRRPDTNMLVFKMKLLRKGAASAGGGGGGGAAEGAGEEGEGEG